MHTQTSQKILSLWLNRIEDNHTATHLNTILNEANDYADLLTKLAGKQPEIIEIYN